MAYPFAMRVGAVAACAAALVSSLASAQEVHVTGNDCAASIRVEARDARLSEVLKRVAQALDFQLSFDADADPLVTINAMRDPVDVLTLVASAQNVSIAKARNPRCPERERIVKVWILGKGPKVAAVAKPAVQAPQPNAAEQARAQEGINMILQAHGVATPDEEQQGDSPH